MKISFDISAFRENDNVDAFKVMQAVHAIAVPGTVTVTGKSRRVVTVNGIRNVLRGSLAWSSLADKVVDEDTDTIIKSRTEGCRCECGDV